MLDRARWRAFARSFLDGIVPSSGAGWATTSLYLSLRNAFLTGTIGFYVLLAVSVLVEGPGHRWLVPLLLLIGLAAWVARAAIVDRVPAWLSVWAVFVLSTLAACVAGSPESLLLFTSTWAVHLATAMPAVVLRGWTAFAGHFVGCVGYSVAVALAHPEWGPVIPQGQVVAGYGILLVLRAGLALLAEFAARADARSVADDEEFARLAQRRLHGREVVESARVLHDTAINTLAAIAAGDGATRDLALVRARCASDRQALVTLREGAAAAPAQRVFAALDRAGLALERSGLDGAELAAALAAYSDEVRVALERASYEVVQNAAKHAGVGAVRFDVRRSDDRLLITIADAGIGFDAEAAPLRGLASSVYRRAEEVGIDVELTSSPGEGTTVVLRAPAAATAHEPVVDARIDGDALLAVVRAVREGAVWLWAVGVLSVGVFLEVANVSGRLTPTYAALALGAAGIAVAWPTRAVRTGPVRLLVDGLLVAVAAASFALAVATSDFGQDEPALWQVLANTGTLVLLHGVGGRWALRAGLAAHLAAGVVLGAVVWPESSTAALIVVAGAAIGACFLAGWLRFDQALGAIGRQLAENQRRVLRARVDEDLRARSEDLRESWRSAGLERVEALLAGIAAGSLDPRDPQVRQDCGDEEFHLRKLIQLDPELVRLMPWLLQAVGAAREQGVDLVVRSGAVEPSDEETVDWIGAAILRAVRSAGRGQRVTVSLYQLESGELSLILVAPHSLLSGFPATGLDAASTFLARVGDSDMLEARVPV